MVRNVRTNVKKMVNHTIGVGKSPDPGIIVHLVSNSTFLNYILINNAFFFRKTT